MMIEGNGCIHKPLSCSTWEEGRPQIQTLSSSTREEGKQQKQTNIKTNVCLKPLATMLSDSIFKLKARPHNFSLTWFLFQRECRSWMRCWSPLTPGSWSSCSLLPVDAAPPRVLSPHPLPDAAAPQCAAFLGPQWNPLLPKVWKWLIRPLGKG